MRFPTSAFCLSLLLTIAAFGQSTMPATYTALQSQLEKQPDSVRMDQLADFIWAKIERGNFTEATAASQEMMSVAKRTGNPLFLGRAYIAAGYIAQNEENPTQAIVNYQRAGTIYQARNEWHRQVAALERIGNVYVDVRNLPLAESYLSKALTLARQHNLTDDIVNLYADLATVYDIRKQFDKALSFNAQCIKLAKSTGAYYSGALVNRGIILKNAGQYEKSLVAYTQALTLAENQKDLPLTYAVYMNIPNTLLLMNRLDEAERYARLALQAIQEQPNQQSRLQEIYETLTTIYEKRGQYRQALAYHKQWGVHRDSVFNATKSRQLVEAETRFQTREKQQQIQRLDEDNLRKQQQLTLLIGGIVLLVLLLGTMVWQYRALRQANRRVNQTLNELNRTQDRLIQQEKMASLGELTAGIAHEIQNPLNFVNNFAEVSVDLARELHDELDKVAMPADEKAYLGDIVMDLVRNQTKINQHGQRAANIVHGMLEHARTSTGERQATNLNALANEYLRIAYSGFQAKNKNGFDCQLMTDYDADLGPIELVPQEIGRVLLNLFNNAFYAVQQGALLAEAGYGYQPIVRVSTKRLAGKVEIRVSDNGMGIADAVKAKIFQPFFTTKPTGEGTGLGLSLSYDIVTKGHGGTLEVESTAGEGSVFMMTLPG